MDGAEADILLAHTAGCRHIGGNSRNLVGDATPHRQVAEYISIEMDSTDGTIQSDSRPICHYRFSDGGVCLGQKQENGAYVDSSSNGLDCCHCAIYIL